MFFVSNVIGSVSFKNLEKTNTPRIKEKTTKKISKKLVCNS